MSTSNPKPDAAASEREPNEVERLRILLHCAKRDRDRFREVLEHIEGGDDPCLDESLLRQWAYEAVTLGRSVDELSEAP